MDQVCYGISNSFPINQQSCENTALSELMKQIKTFTDRHKSHCLDSWPKKYNPVFCPPSVSPLHPLEKLHFLFLLTWLRVSTANPQVYTHTYTQKTNVADLKWLQAGSTSSISDRAQLQFRAPLDWRNIDTNAHARWQLSFCVCLTQLCLLIWPVLPWPESKPVSYATSYFSDLGQHLHWESPYVDSAFRELENEQVRQHRCHSCQIFTL